MKGFRSTFWAILAVSLLAVGMVYVVLSSGEEPRSESVVQPVQSPSLEVGVSAVGLDPERGLPAFVSHFVEADHGGHRESWDIVQAPSGLMYVANSDGVLEFDGSEWRLIAIPGYVARAITLGPDGRIHVGGEGTAGILTPDSTGRLQYQPLVEDLLEGADVWTAVAAQADSHPEGAVVFQTFGRLVTVRDDRVIDVQEAPQGRRFHKAFSAGGRVYVRLEGEGLLRYDPPYEEIEGTLTPIRGGGEFADRPIRALFDIDGRPGGSLLATTDSELFRLDPYGSEGVAAVPSEATPVLQQTRAYHGCSIGPSAGSGRLFAITTLGGGVVLLDREGRVSERLGPEVGLSLEALVFGCTMDDQGGLWLATSEGLFRIDAASPLSRFDRQLGLPGAVYSITRYEERLYVATDQGIYSLEPGKGGRAASFLPVGTGGDDLGQVWELESTSYGLIAAATNGVYRIRGLAVELILPIATYSLHSSDLGILAGTRNGIHVIRERGTGWDARRLPQIEGEVWSIKPDGEGGAWAELEQRHLARVHADGKVRVYTKEAGVPSRYAAISWIDESLVTLSPTGVFDIEVGPGGQRVIVSEDTQLNSLIARVAGNPTEGYGLSEDEQGRVWVTGRDQVLAAVRRAGHWVDVTPSPIRQVPGVLAVMPEDETLWFGTDDGLLRLAGTGWERYDVSPRALVRSVEVGGEELPAGPSATIPYGSPVRLSYSATAYNDVARTQYRTQLVGHDEEPSRWSDERFREYTNLPPGRFLFRVEAQSATGARDTGEILVIVPPPWYLTWWAYVLFVIGSTVVIAGIVRLRGRIHRRRLWEEQQRSAELRRLNAELVHADQLKNDLLANTSHELRTPLTAILGYAELLRDEIEDEELRPLAEAVLKGGHRLLQTVNALLSMHKLESDTMELIPTAVDVAVLVRETVDSIRPLAAEKGLALSVLPTGLRLPTEVDARALESIVTNLVGNAIKFTGEGAVSVLMDQRDHMFHLTVRDTGRGIAPEFLPRLFDPFEQESRGHARSHEGSGLGLAITQRLVDLMGGEIRVESEEGVGTTFWVEIPMVGEPTVETAWPASGDERASSESGTAVGPQTARPSPSV